jgi:signal transduction histidine kinase
MIKTSPKRWLLGLTVLWMTTILALGIWWLFLLVKLSNLLEINKQLPSGMNFIRLVKYEGGTFLMLLILISITLLYFYFQELKQTNMVRAFFASLTHELKTPLASMRLQAEVIHDLVENKKFDSLHDYAHRLIDDGKRLELEMDKILQLSRVQKGGRINLVEVDLKRFIKNLIQKNYQDLKFELNTNDTDIFIIADEFALSLIIRNLIDNSLKHCATPSIKFDLVSKHEQVKLIYTDHGNFSGNLNKLGQLFYKHNSPKGSGIGLYLIKELMLQMHGTFKAINNTPLEFQLEFRKDSTHA